jgi:transaldolase
MNDYLLWLANETESIWWNDSANLSDLESALQHGAQGVTTNPVLIADTIYKDRADWHPYLKDIPADIKKSEKAEAIIKAVTCKVAEMFLPIYQKTNGNQGFVCAQVDPRKPAERTFMFDMAKRLHAWAPNIAVKLPVTAAGLDILEECIAIGITITATVSFTMPQAVMIGKRYMMGAARAKASRVKPGKCFAVVMVGRTDDYLRDVVHDGKNENVLESDIIQSGTAVIKRAYAYYKEHGIDAVLMPAGMRGEYHAEALSGARMSMSINPKIQVMLPKIPKPYAIRIDEPVDSDVIRRLMTVPEFVRVYEPEGMRPEEFITCGVVQKTLAQFVENWNKIEEYSLEQ